MSTNKVYGDAPNRIALKELATRWDYADPAYAARHPGDLHDRPVDAFASSAPRRSPADVMVQEYGRYFNMPTCACAAAA